MDGSRILIIAPPVNAKDYYNRKGFHSILLQGDHQCKFMDVYIGWLGSAHDARVLTNSDVVTKAEAGTLFPDNKRCICGQDIPLLMLGDPVYPLLPWLMKPFSDCGSLTRRQRKFITSSVKLGLSLKLLLVV